MSSRGEPVTGFTLTEMLTVITIAATLMAIGVPSYRAITNSSRIAGEVNSLLGDMQLARAEAVKQGLPVTACVSADGATCANSVNWQSGWIVFVDTNGNQTKDVGEAALKTQDTFQSTDTFVSDTARAVTFNREGFATLIAGGTIYTNTLITLRAASASVASTRCLSLNRLGRMTVQKSGTGTCS